MDDPSFKDHSRRTTPETPANGEDGLTELRHLLFAPETTRLTEIKERLDDPQLHARDISEVLPDAVRIRSTRDTQLTTALTPIVEEAIHTSVQKSPQMLVDAISPLMGPAIRKSILVTIQGMIQSLNQAIEHSFSVKGLGWRLEALRTGKPFAEIVLLHSLVYRVEHVFLIHKKTGLLLQHVNDGVVTIEHEDLVSSMLTAIQDFVQDSFGTQQGDGLSTLQVGGMTVWIEQGSQALLATVIRGTPPEALRPMLLDVLDTIHAEHADLLVLFEGDSTPFEAVRPSLEDCLQRQYQDVKKRKTSPLLWMMGATIIVAFGLWTFSAIREHLRWTDYIATLQAQPGIVVTSTERRDGKYIVVGLRDPMAEDPEAILATQTVIAPETVASVWEPYYALTTEFQLARARRALKPPATVTLSMEHAILRARGAAPHRWVVEAGQLARTLPGIDHYHDDDVLDTDVRELEAYKMKIEHLYFQYPRGSSAISEALKEQLELTSETIKKMDTSAQRAGKHVHIDIIGHADEIGSETVNLAISQRRAARLLAKVDSPTLAHVTMTARGIGTQMTRSDGSSDRDPASNRRVSFNLRITDVLP